MIGLLHQNMVDASDALLDSLGDGLDEMFEGAEGEWWVKPAKFLVVCSPIILVLAYYYW